MDYLSPNENYWALDIEGDSLNPTVIWVAVANNVITNEIVILKSAKEFHDWYKTDYVLVMHNGVKFDTPVLNRLWQAGIPKDSTIDTLVMSSLYDPNLKGGHSLKAYGERFKDAKGDFTDFSAFSEEMLKYCIQDTKLTIKVYKALCKKLLQLDCTNLALEIEHKVASIIGEQQRNGFKFDRIRALALRDQLRGREKQVEQEILHVFPPTLSSKGVYQYRTKASGAPYQSYIRHSEQYDKLSVFDGGRQYEVFSYEPFNIGSPKQRLQRLLGLGYKPTQFTPKGNPKVDEDALTEFAKTSGVPEVGLIAEWLYTNGRANMIQTWLDNCDDDDFIRGNVFSCGAQSRRMKHSSPNTANIPGTDKPYGKEVRALWTARDGRVLVGVDASALEGMMLLHHLNSKAAWKYFVDGDPHQQNSDALKLGGFQIERKPSKNFFYGFLYGAGDKKMGAMYGASPADGKAIKEILGSAIPGLSQLVNNIGKEWRKNNGVLRCIDGGFVRCPSESAALNYKLQPDGAILMKQAKIIADGIFEQDLASSLINEKPLWVGDIHDEWQIDCLPSVADYVGKTCVSAIEQAAKLLKFSVPVTGEYKIGNNWADTH